MLRMSKTEGWSLTRPPYSDGSNYVYWKAKMKIFLKSLNESVWQAVVRGWTPPTKEVVDANGVRSFQTMDYLKWSHVHKSLSTANARALNAITCAVSPDEFQRILGCETAPNKHGISLR